MLESYVAGCWHLPTDEGLPLLHAATGEQVARVSTQPTPAAHALAYARHTAGPTLRDLTFPQRAAILKSLGQHLMSGKDELYDISYATGSTTRDSAIDIDGGFGTLLSYASMGRRELPPGKVYIDGPVDKIGRTGSFVAQHLMTPLRGAALQVNAYNFPVWGMLEKFAPAFLAGVPSIVKPASQTAYVTELAVRRIVESGLLPAGALQLLVGGTQGLLDNLDGQDLVSFTGSAATAAVLRTHPSVVTGNVRFNAEADSLNCAVLGFDGAQGTAEFELFVQEVVREMTAKAGQKCTAIRRAFVPRQHFADVEEALSAALSTIVVGDPRDPSTDMGPLVNVQQCDNVKRAIQQIGGEVSSGSANFALPGWEKGAFLPPILLRQGDPDHAAVHDVEAFGPVSTLLPYDTVPQVVALMARGSGSLVGSVVSYDLDFVEQVVLGAAAFHGRLHVLDRTTAQESTGHGSPLPTLVHGGPGRAGGGEELGGVRSVLHHLQRTAVQGSPAVLSRLTGSYVRGCERIESDVHPFRKSMAELTVGDTLVTGTREVTRQDIDQFAAFTGDTFYAHTDEVAAAANPLFGGIVAHGYLVLSLAAGLFVDPAPGPVLANTGLDRLRFSKPVKPGDSIHVVLTCAALTPRTAEQGEVRWDVQVLDQNNVVVASYELLTMVRCQPAS